MSREKAIEAASDYFNQGEFLKDLQSRIEIDSVSQDNHHFDKLNDYLTQQMVPLLESMGFTWEIYENPVAQEAGAWPFLIAERIESEDLLTVLSYGHGDVVNGYDDQWKDGLSPWSIKVEGNHWYGRGTADNKGQHSINLAALQQVLKIRGSLGFNVKLILEMGEEAGSPGLAEFCQLHQAQLKADLFIGSDGPRVGAEYPTVFLGSRGSLNFDLRVNLRPGSYHSGNWGGLLANAGTRLIHAWASLVDAKGKILVPGLLPHELPAAVRAAIRGIPVGTGPSDPEIDASWGEPGLTPSERVFGWNTLELLACQTGNPQAPANAIPGSASLHGQIRYVVGSDSEHFIEIIRDHLDRNGFDDVDVFACGVTKMEATRLDPTDPWVSWALDSIRRTTDVEPTLLPNLGGSIPNNVFSQILGLPTLWIPHSYPACLQHGPNEHLLASVALQGLKMMAGIFWDLAETGQAVKDSRL
ncbi:M20 family metallopeptidase [Celerinatantimonas sp. YJH-8]|uniref:M20 family metallopeptidase n=1 Tax=Celerinatantimonas sp. YJH-8 TaxID=3228714 RepID=UPI0038C7AD55